MPSLTLQLPPDTEALLREQAARAGKDISQYLTGLIKSSPRRPVKTLSVQETSLFQAINRGFTAEFWQKLRILDAKRIAETLTEAEHQEFILLAEEVEKAQAGRIAALAELAQLRGMDIDDVMLQLGIQHGAV